MIYSGFLFTTILFTWYSVHLIRDVSGVDQFWHYPQMIFLIAIYLMPLIVARNKLVYLYRICCYGVMFPFIFNTGLNIGRGLPLDHLGRYDFLAYWQTVVLAIVGLFGIIIFELVKNKKYQLESFKWIKFSFKKYRELPQE